MADPRATITITRDPEVECRLFRVQHALGFLRKAAFGCDGPLADFHSNDAEAIFAMLENELEGAITLYCS